MLFLIGCTIYQLVVFDGASDFRKVADVPSLRSVNSPNIFCLNDRVFVFSGISTISKITLVQMFSVMSRFRIRKISGILPPPRAGATCCEFNNEIVMVGGLHIGATSEEFCDDAWAFNGEAWRELKIIGPSLECVHAMCRVMCDKIVIYGGYNGKTAYGLTYNDSIWVLDPVLLKTRFLKTQVHQNKFRSQKFMFQGLNLLIDDERVDISELFAMEI